MSKYFQFKNIRTRLLVWFLVVGIVPLFVATFIISQNRIAAIKHNQFQKLMGIRDLKAAEIDDWIDDRIGDVKTISEDHEIIDYTTTAAHISNTVRGKEWKIAQGLLRRYIDNYVDYHELLVINAESGHVIVSTNEVTLGDDKSTDSYFTGALESKGVFIKDIYRSESHDNRPMMTFSVPIWGNENGDKHPVGVLVVRIDVESSLYKSLLNRTGMGQTGETLIVNRHGIALNQLRYIDDAPLHLKIQAEPAVRASAGLSGVIEALDYRDEPVLAAYTYISRTGWGFVAKQDQKEVYASIQKLYRSVSIIALLVGLSIVFFSLLLAKITVRPILDMVKASQKMAAGDFSARASTTTSDETNVLALSLNQLAGKVSSQLEVSQGLARVSDAIVSANNLEDLGKKLLATYVEIANAEAGAFYIIDELHERFEPLTSLGCDVEKLMSFDAGSLEGEFGKAISMQQVNHNKQIPEDTTFTYKTVYGNAVPKEIITIPLIANEMVAGILTLACLRACSENCLAIINQSLVNLNTGFSSVQNEEKIQKIASELIDKNQELESFSEELQSQTEELQEQNVELATQRSQVEEANRLKSEFLSNMSHELRTPLNSIMALSKVLMQQTSDRLSDDESDYLKIVERNGKQLLLLINDILDLSKIEAGQMEVFASEFSLKNMIEEFVENFQLLADKNGNVISSQIADDLPITTSDETMVHRILQNLISNAVKFTNAGEVVVTAETQGTNIIVAVQDTGIGISEESLPYIFEEFRQVDGSASRSYEGTGLGLAIAERSALLLEGRLEVVSVPGSGSTFTLTLPIRNSSANVPLSNQQSGLISSVETTKNLGIDEIRLLVVEDQKAAIIQLKSILIPAGFTVDIAGGGQAALDYLKDNTPDGIILDLMMPEVNGFEVLESVRNNPSTMQVPILVMTSKSLTKQDREGLRANNVSELVQKGDVNPKELMRKIGAMLHLEAPAPVTSHKNQVDKPLKKTISKSSGNGKASILVIDDNPDNLAALKAVLEKEYTLRSAMDGEDGWDLIQSEQPDLILTDIMMPKLDGLALTGRIKAREDLKNIPVIALTGKAMKGDMEKILAAGCDDYLAKPFDMDELNDKVKSWLHS